MTFPDVRWGSEASRLRGPLVAFSCSKPGSWLIRKATPLDRKLLMSSKGKYTVLGPLGIPMLLLTTTGAKSGLPRTTPLVYTRHGGGLVVVGSNFGQAHHPLWTKNLLAHPDPIVSIGGQEIPAVATLLEGDDAEAAYNAMEAQARTYTEYRSRTDRDIRVFRLTPA
ncbi:MAG: nitroreductase [Frankiales bacterium]|nr:nitroreductase [Frankiales bacterium]